MALVRDKYLCQHCLIHDNKITSADVVHHIKELKDYPNSALDLGNLICLCHKHHNLIHNKDKENKKRNKTKNKNVIVFEANEELV